MNTVPREVWRKPSYFIAFGFGSGAMPFMPGTFGTLMAIPFYLLLQRYSLLTYAIIIFAAFLIGVWLCDVISKEIMVEDHSGMAWDEVVGYGITMFAAPKGWFWVGLGFALFRLFDIWKPSIIGLADRKIHGGFGMMFDDLLAAIAAWIILQIIAYLFHASIILL